MFKDGKLSLALALSAVVFVSACMPSEVKGTKPDGSSITLQFYPGGSRLDDLVIIAGKNYFGKAQYQTDDPLGDIGFRLKSGERV